MIHQRFHSPSQSSRPFWNDSDARDTIINTFSGAKMCLLDTDILQFAAECAKINGLWIELGVASGQTIRFLAECFPDQTIFGFDSFKGLPDDWIRHDSIRLKGTYSQNTLPQVPQNVCLIQGMFHDVLPQFTKEHVEPIALLHIDCDLYTSTKESLEILAPQIVSGTIIIFDEFYNYPGCQLHESKAFEEFLTNRNLSARALAYNALHEQAVFEIIE
jgi:hypothetical protein